MFVERFSAAVTGLRTGDVLGAGTGGAADQREGCDQGGNTGRRCPEQGASLLRGGHRREGLYFEPTVLANATPAMRIAREEVFGPVAAIFRFHTEAEAIAMANDTEYGLAAYVYSRDVGRCWRVAEALEYGMVGINEGLMATEVAPFGGTKASGMGREGSRYGLDAFLEMKYLCYGGV